MIDCEEDTDVVRLHTLKHAISSIKLILVSQTPPETLSDQPNKSSFGEEAETGTKDNLEAVDNARETLKKHGEIIEELISVQEQRLKEEEGMPVYLSGNNIQAHQDNVNESVVENGTKGIEKSEYDGSDADNGDLDEGLYQEGEEIEMENCTLSRLYQFVAVKFAKKLKANMRYKLVIKSVSHIGSMFLRGLYSSAYTEDGETK